jgi:hypothetical protein
VRPATAGATKRTVVLGSIIEEASMRRIVPFSACLFAGAVLLVAPPSTTASAASAASPFGLQQGLALDDGLHLARRGGGGFRGGGGGMRGGFRGARGFSGGSGFSGRAFAAPRSFGYRAAPRWGGRSVYRARVYRGGRVWRGRSVYRAPIYRGGRVWRGRSYAWRGHRRWRAARWGWAPFYGSYYYGGCRLVLRRVWTPYGWRRRWVRRCYW